MSTTDVVIALVLGVGTGVISGMLGVGGGLLMVPGMVLMLGLTQHVAEGTSLLVIIPTAVVGAYTHWRHGYVAVTLAGVLAAAGIFGALAGSHLALGVSNRTLKILFVIYLLIMGARMIAPGRREAKTA